MVRGLNRVVLVIAVIGILLAFNKLCIAEPDSTVRYLMNERVTALDFGLYRLEKYLNAFYSGDPYVNPSVSYDWDTNRIKIFVWNTKGGFKDIKEAKSWCNLTICEIRSGLGIDCSTVKSRIPTGNSLLYQYFSHHSYKSVTEPEGLGSKIDKIVEITVGAYWGKNKKFLRCNISLLGTEVLCTD